MLLRMLSYMTLTSFLPLQRVMRDTYHYHSVFSSLSDLFDDTTAYGLFH